MSATRYRWTFRVLLTTGLAVGFWIASAARPAPGPAPTTSPSSGSGQAGGAGAATLRKAPLVFTDYPVRRIDDGLDLRPVPGKTAIHPVTRSEGQSVRATEAVRTVQRTLASRTIRCKVTAYTAGPESTGKRPGNPGYGITASGKPVTANGGKFCAADKSIPFGTMIDIPGYGVVPVLDRGGAIRGNRLDVFIPDLDAARRWGVKWLDVEVIVP